MTYAQQLAESLDLKSMAGLERIIDSCISSVEGMPGEPPGHYTKFEADGNQAAVQLADQCWRKGMQELKRELLDWFALPCVETTSTTTE